MGENWRITRKAEKCIIGLSQRYGRSILGPPPDEVDIRMPKVMNALIPTSQVPNHIAMPLEELGLKQNQGSSATSCCR